MPDEEAKFHWSDYKTKSENHDTEARHCRIGDVQIYVRNPAKGNSWSGENPNADDAWQFVIYGAGAGEVMFEPFTSGRWVTREEAIENAERLLRILMPLALAMVSVQASKSCVPR